MAHVGVLGRQNPAQRLQHRHLAPEPVVELAQLQADRAGANHEQRRGKRRPRQGFRASPPTVNVQPHPRRQLLPFGDGVRRVFRRTCKTAGPSKKYGALSGAGGRESARIPLWLPSVARGESGPRRTQSDHLHHVGRLASHHILGDTDDVVD
jgi:hypothetical protein